MEEETLLRDDFMLQDAIQDLYSGFLTSWDRELLVESFLPNDVTDPFFSQETNPGDLMNITFFSLSGWISESKKTGYFSDRFVSLSRLVLKGVSTMGRALVTLHDRGEDLSDAPMQIGDLISAASYQFRKSYLGMLQNTRRDPKNSERLLINQLNWTTMLLRLYKTREKLEKQASPKNAEALRENNGTSLPQQDEAFGTLENKILRSVNWDAIEPLEAFPSAGSREAAAAGGHSALADLSAFSEVRAISPVRALSSFDKRSPYRKETQRRKKQTAAQTETGTRERSDDLSAETAEITPETDTPHEPACTDPEPAGQNGEISQIESI